MIIRYCRMTEAGHGLILHGAAGCGAAEPEKIAHGWPGFIQHTFHPVVPHYNIMDGPRLEVVVQALDGVGCGQLIYVEKLKQGTS